MLWYVLVLCVCCILCFLVAKTESVESENEFAHSRTCTRIRICLASNENENIKNVENTEIEYVWGFKQHYVVASIGFSVEENAFYFAIFGGCRGRVIVSLGQ